MKQNLSPEQLEKRKNINSKILKFGCLPIFLIFVIILVISSFLPNSSELIKKSNINMDSIVAKVSKSKDFEIKEVYYNKKDSSFNISITNKDNVIKEKDYSITYFDKMYHLDSINEIEGVYLYEYINGKSFEKGDYKNPLQFESARYTKIVDKFDDKYYSSYLKSYKPLNDYLQNTLKDPSSLEFVNTEKTGYTDGVFSIEATFRAKNSFGALVLNSVSCHIDVNGNISNVQINK